MSWFSFRPNLLLNTLHEVFIFPIENALITSAHFDLAKTTSLIQFMMLLELLGDLFSIATRSSMYFYISFRPNKLFETVLYPLQSILGIAGFSGDM